MNIILGKVVKIKEIDSKLNVTINSYLHQYGKIVGQKKIYNKYIVAIIEFKNHTRIWMLPEELE